MTEYKAHPPVHPGELLRDEFLEPMGMTAYELAKGIGVPAPRVYDIVREKRGISADTALRLSRFFGMSEGYWINAQAHYDLQVASDQAREKIEREVVPRSIAWSTKQQKDLSRQAREEYQKELDRRAEEKAAGRWAEDFVSGRALPQRIRMDPADLTLSKERLEDVRADLENTFLVNDLRLPSAATSEEISLMRMKLEESDDPQQTLEIAQQAIRTARVVIGALLNKQTSYEAIPNHYYDDPNARRRIERLRVALQQHQEEAVEAAQALEEIHFNAARRLNNQVLDMRGEVDRLLTLLRQVSS